MTRPEPGPPARNRVTPLGEIVAVPRRGSWMGNRGRLHEGVGVRDVVRGHQHKAWITCTLSFKDRRLPQWQPGHYTQLFFLDEAVALAAGHRPCAECRRADYNAYRDAWAAGHGAAVPHAKEMDEQLHGERRGGATCRTGHERAWADLPDGVFVALGHGLAVLIGDHLAYWDEEGYGYGTHRPRPRSGLASVLTPPSSVAALRAGYPVQIDDTAR